MDQSKMSAIDNKVRRTILNKLKDRPYTVSELADSFSLSVPTVKEHIDKLVNAGLVKLEESDRERKWKYYSLTRDGDEIVKSSTRAIPINVVIMFGIVIIGIVIILTMFGNLKLGFNQETGTGDGTEGQPLAAGAPEAGSPEGNREGESAGKDNTGAAGGTTGEAVAGGTAGGVTTDYYDYSTLNATVANETNESMNITGNETGNETPENVTPGDLQPPPGPPS